MTTDCLMHLLRSLSTNGSSRKRCRTSMQYGDHEVVTNYNVNSKRQRCDDDINSLLLMITNSLPNNIVMAQRKCIKKVVTFNETKNIMYQHPENITYQDKVALWISKAEYTVLRSSITDTLRLYRHQKLQLQQQEDAHSATKDDDNDIGGCSIRGIEHYVSSDITQEKFRNRHTIRRMVLFKYRLEQERLKQVHDDEKNENANPDLRMIESMIEQSYYQQQNDSMNKVLYMAKRDELVANQIYNDSG